MAAIQRAVTTELAPPGETFSDKLDRVLTHKVWGTLIFLAIMTLMFQSIFTFARIPMDALQSGVDWLGGAVGSLIPPGDLNSLLVDGVIAGVGAVVVFLPQILLLFLFIGFLEDTGYMARAAFLMDRLMSKVGLHGKSFIPMLSSFACAIPGIMATRTIESPKDRLVTILVAPLMSCSARLPVYTLLIAACIPEPHGARLPQAARPDDAVACICSASSSRCSWPGCSRRPCSRAKRRCSSWNCRLTNGPCCASSLRHMWDRSKLFLRRAGTVILGINILLWFLATYPHSAATAADPGAQRAQLKAQLAQAAFARAGRSPARRTGGARQPGRRRTTAPELCRPPGPAHRTGHCPARLRLEDGHRHHYLALPPARSLSAPCPPSITSARATPIPSSMTSLAQTLQAQKRPDGTPVYTPLTAVTLMVFYVFALQCVSTVAIVRRETNSWKWPFFQWLYMGVLAWGLAFLTHSGGPIAGLGREAGRSHRALHPCEAPDSASGECSPAKK